MLGLDHHEHPAGRERAIDRLRDLGRQAFLDLRLREQVDDPRDLRQTGDLLRLVGDVRDMRLPGERDQVVLAERLQRDVADHDQLVVVGAFHHRDELRGVLADPGERLLVHAGDARGRFPQAAPVGVLTDPFKDQAYAFLDLLGVERVGWPEQIHRADATGEPTRPGRPGGRRGWEAHRRVGDRLDCPAG